MKPAPNDLDTPEQPGEWNVILAQFKCEKKGRIVRLTPRQIYLLKKRALNNPRTGIRIDSMEAFGHPIAERK